MPERSMARLDEIKEKTEATSYAEVVKNSLRLYEALIHEFDAGNEFFLHHPDGSQTKLKIF